MKNFYSKRKEVSIINFSSDKEGFDTNKYTAEFRQYVNELEKKPISKIVEPQYVCNFTDEIFFEYKRHEDYKQELINSDEMMESIENEYR